MALQTFFKPVHSMRGAEALKMSNEETKNGNGGVRVPPWFWAILASVAVQIISAAYNNGKVAAQMDGISYRVGRIEVQMDRFFGVARP